MLDYDKLEQLNTETLKRENLGNNLNFNQVNDVILKIKNRLLFFKDKPVEALTIGDKGKIGSLGGSFISLCEQIIAFQHNGNEDLATAIARRDAIINQFAELEKQFNITVLPLMHEIMLFDEETQNKLSNLNKTVEEISKKNEENNKIFNENINTHNQQLGQMKKEFGNQLKEVGRIKQNAIQEVDDIKRKAQDFSTEAVVEKYGTIFDEQAKTNKKIAYISLGFLIFFGLFLIWLANYLFKPLIDMLLEPDNNISYGFLATSLIFRLTILSVLFIAIKESLKNFNVNMHLYNLNKHRQNALKSFDTFKGIPNSDETRDCLIKEIARTIYSVNKIGYLSESKKTADTSQIIDLIKSIKP